jgi:Tfp pilus assembly ATPase PilU
MHPYGMITFDQSLANLVKQRLVTYEEAVKHASSPSDFALLFRGVGANADRFATADKDAGNGDFEIEQ